MTRRLTQEQARDMRASKLKGATYDALSDRFGVSRTMACRIVLGYDYREAGQVRKYQPAEATKTGMNCEECGRWFRYWLRPIDPPRKFCGKRCWSINANKEKKKLPEPELLCELYHGQKLSLVQIAERYGSCHQAVACMMQRNGIARRPRGPAL